MTDNQTIWTITLYTPADEVCKQKGIAEDKRFNKEIRKEISHLSKKLGLPMGTIGCCGMTSRSRTVGFFFSKEDAFNAVESNGIVYNEMGYYNYVIVENYQQGAWGQNWPQSAGKSPNGQNKLVITEWGKS